MAWWNTITFTIKKNVILGRATTLMTMEEEQWKMKEKNGKQVTIPHIYIL